MATYQVILSPAARRQLHRIRGSSFVALRGLILSMGDEPRPTGAAKLAGRPDLWRIRVRIDGRPWRVVHHLDDRDQLVVVTRVAPRDEGAYRGL